MKSKAEEVQLKRLNNKSEHLINEVEEGKVRLEALKEENKRLQERVCQLERQVEEG